MSKVYSAARLTEREKNEILAKAAKRLGVKTGFASLEELLVARDGFGLDTATPLQRAICRLVEGRPLEDLAGHAHVISALGGVTNYQTPPKPPREVVIISGIRTAKSMIAAGIAIQATQNCDLSMLTAGEIPRYSVLSLSVDNAKVIMGHIGGVLDKPRCKALRVNASKESSYWKELIRESQSEDSWSFFVWHPSGRPVEIRVVAGRRAGGSVVSRWSVGATLDEAPRMVGGDEGVINYDDTRDALLGRLVPGAQLVSIGSPWAPWGPVFDLVNTEWGKPTPQRVVLKAPGPLMNPVLWTPEKCEEMRLDPRSATAYKTDVLAEFADVEEALIPSICLQKCTRTDNVTLDFSPRQSYVAAMDPATRGNAWALAILSRKGDQKQVVCVKQWVGNPNAPLSPRLVLQEIAEVLREYELDWCYTDQWASDALRDLAWQHGLALVIEDWNEKTKAEAYQALAQAFAESKINIPNEPLLVRDLRMVQKVPTQKGFAIRLPVTPDGRHCDFAPVIARGCLHFLNDARDRERKLNPDEEMALQEEQLAAKVSKGSTDEWWAQSPLWAHGD